MFFTFCNTLSFHVSRLLLTVSLLCRYGFRPPVKTLRIVWHIWRSDTRGRAGARRRGHCLARRAQWSCRRRRRRWALAEAEADHRRASDGRAGSQRRRSAATTPRLLRSEEHTSELQSLMRISYAVFCLKKKQKSNTSYNTSTYSTLPPIQLHDCNIHP